MPQKKGFGQFIALRGAQQERQSGVFEGGWLMPQCTHDISLEGNELARFVNNEASLKVHNMATYFWKSLKKCTFLCGTHVHQKSQQGTQKFLHQNFWFFQPWCQCQHSAKNYALNFEHVPMCCFLMNKGKRTSIILVCWIFQIITAVL